MRAKVTTRFLLVIATALLTELTTAASLSAGTQEFAAMCLLDGADLSASIASLVNAQLEALLCSAACLSKRLSGNL